MTTPYEPIRLTQHWNGLVQLLSRVLKQLPLRTHRFGHSEAHDNDGQSEEDVADVLAGIRREATAVHNRLAHDHDVFAVEVLGATGAGKTALVETLVKRAPADEHIGVIAGDVAGDDDARRYRDLGVAVTDVTTGKDCHLDPGRVDGALDSFDLDRLDTLFIENVGNMVCPADFPLGAALRVVVVSVTEGDDVVRKHPLLFQTADIAVINKTDIADAVGTNVERMRTDVSAIAPSCPVIETSAETEAGIDQLDAVLRDGQATHAHGADTQHDHDD